jgi:hypothetical protein
MEMMQHLDMIHWGPAASRDAEAPLWQSSESLDLSDLDAMVAESDSNLRDVVPAPPRNGVDELFADTRTRSMHCSAPPPPQTDSRVAVHSLAQLRQLTELIRSEIQRSEGMVCAVHERVSLETYLNTDTLTADDATNDQYTVVDDHHTVAGDALRKPSIANWVIHAPSDLYDLW